jgi:hypothetical protein
VAVGLSRRIARAKLREVWSAAALCGFVFRSLGGEIRFVNLLMFLMNFSLPIGDAGFFGSLTAATWRNEKIFASNTNVGIRALQIGI